MFNQQMPDVERQWFQTVSLNARRLHVDALKLFRADSFSSSIVISTYALEEMGKLISFQDFPKAAVRQPKQHESKQKHLARSSLWLCWAIALAKILDRPLPGILEALDDERFDLELLMACKGTDETFKATLDSSQQEQFDALWEKLEQDPLCQFSVRFGLDIAPKLTEIRHASLYVDYRDGVVSNPLHGSKELAWLLIEDTKQVIELIDILAKAVAEHEAKLANPAK